MNPTNLRDSSVNTMFCANGHDILLNITDLKQLFEEVIFYISLRKNLLI